MTTCTDLLVIVIAIYTSTDLGLSEGLKNTGVPVVFKWAWSVPPGWDGVNWSEKILGQWDIMLLIFTSIGFTNFLDVSSLSFSFLQLKMRHLKKIRETNAGTIDFYWSHEGMNMSQRPECTNCTFRSLEHLQVVTGKDIYKNLWNQSSMNDGWRYPKDLRCHTVLLGVPWHRRHPKWRHPCESKSLHSKSIFQSKYALRTLCYCNYMIKHFYYLSPRTAHLALSDAVVFIIIKHPPDFSGNHGNHNWVPSINQSTIIG